MKYLLIFSIVFIPVLPLSSQTINCQLTPLNSLDFFFDGPGNEEIIWPDSTIKQIESSLQDSVENNVAFQFLPLAMLEMRSYFENGIDQEGFYRIIRYSKLFADVFSDNSWQIDVNNFCNGTTALIDRFNGWYLNDSMISNLLFTMDRGPYFGKSFEVKDIEHIYLKDSISFPGTEHKFFLGNYNDYSIIYTTDANGNVNHVTRILEKYHEEDVRSLFSEVKCVPIEDFGFSTLVFVSDGVCRLYFDESGRLRFYFIY